MLRFLGDPKFLFNPYRQNHWETARAIELRDKRDGMELAQFGDEGQVSFGRSLWRLDRQSSR